MLASAKDLELSQFDARKLEAVFSRCFSQTFNTVLKGGFEEPLYSPSSNPEQPAMIQYTQDYFASALHEVAHWCIAGEARLQRVDYGYWYTADGRDAEQQRAFERVEVKPQALEWFFSKACGYPFQISADNLSSPEKAEHDTQAFKRKILQQAQLWCQQGLPVRAQQFYRSLESEFTSPKKDSAPYPSFAIEEL